MKTVFSVSFSVALVCLFSISGIAQKLTTEDIISKHLDSIAIKEKREAVKSQVAVGAMTVDFVTKKQGLTAGRLVMASQGTKNFLGMSFDSVDYPSDKFSFDGNKAKIAYVRVGSRSVLGNFVSSNNFLLEQSLLGGTLSTSWTLLNISGSKAKLSLDGTKKINGRENYVLGYSAKGGSDVNVTLYFDKETFHHVRSEYKRIFSAGMSSDPNQSSRFSESRIKLTEDFADFKEESGITLPHSYTINYTVIGQNGTTGIIWKAALTEFAFNQIFADSAFDAEAD